MNPNTFEFDAGEVFTGVARQTKSGIVIDCPRCRRSIGDGAQPIARARDDSTIFFDPPSSTMIWEKRRGAYIAVSSSNIRYGKRGALPGVGSRVKCRCGFNVILPEPVVASIERKMS